MIAGSEAYCIFNDRLLNSVAVYIFSSSTRPIILKQFSRPIFWKSKMKFTYFNEIVEGTR